jgi:sec-independent protein translocase protein TatA
MRILREYASPRERPLACERMGLGISPMELAVIAIIALVVLGPNKLPEAARSLGKGMREMRDSFQDAAQGHDDDDDVPLALHDEDDDVHDEDVEADPDFEPQPAPSASAEEEDHQKEARSSVPSSSSSSTERE